MRPPRPRTTGTLVSLALAAAALLVATPAGADLPPAPPAGTPAPLDQLWDGAECATITPVPLGVATDLSDDGVVVGADQRRRATSWDSRTGAYRWYGGLGGGLSSTVDVVSPNGRIAGNGPAPNGTTNPVKAFRVEGSLPLQAIDRVGRAVDRVRDVNDANVVVGNSDVLATGAIEAWVWTDRRHVLPLPDGPYAFPDATTVNEAGYIAGTAWYEPVPDQFAGRRRALVWRPDRSVIEVPELPGGAQFRPVHIDEEGRVTGTRFQANGQGDAVVVWSLADGFRIHPLPPAEGRRMSLELSSVNDRGDAVGVAVDLVGSAAVAVRYRPATGFHVLRLAGGPLYGIPFGLNEPGRHLVAMEGRRYLVGPCP